MEKTERAGLRTAVAVAVAMATITVASAAHAFSSGITTASFGVNGCNQCHSGGTAPTVALTGPTEVAPGAINEYTLQIFAPAGQLNGGLNVSTPDGVLSVGGANSAQTQTLPNASLIAEITHTSPKAADAWSTVTFSFLWTAPGAFTSATLTAWGNAVNLNHSPSGDRAAMTTLVITALADTPTPTATADTPTPTDTPVTPVPTGTATLTPTPTATATAANACPADVSPKKPFLVGDETAERCQEAIAKASFLYAKGRFKAVQKCLAKFQAGLLTGDPIAVCHGTLATPPTDTTTAEQVGKAETKARNAIDRRCPTDAAVAALDSCGDTIADAKTCVVATHFQLVEDALTAEYGTLAPTSDKDAQRCQAAIGKAAAKYFVAQLHAMQKCLNARNKSCATGDAGALCLGAVVAGAPVPPADNTTASKLSKAETKLREAINGKCATAPVDQLDACAADSAAVADCVVCSHRLGVFAGIAGEYGGADLFASPATTIQAVVDEAQSGETVMLEPGAYSEAVTIPVDGLTIKGQKTCAGGRAVITNPGSVVNGIFAVARNDLTFQGFEVDDFDQNDIFVSTADGVTFRDMITRAPGTSTGTAYGLFPVLSNNVLVENNVVTGVRDAGIYVGQSTNIVVRNNEVHDNVAGIEIENSANAQVYGNYAHDNAAGFLVFKLPNLSVQISNCHDVHDNRSENNNGPNFGTGSVGTVPSGTGILVYSNDQSAFRNNHVTGNRSLGLAVLDQLILDEISPDDPPFPTLSPDYLVENNYITDNTVTGNGFDFDPRIPLGADTVFIINSAPGGNCQSGNTFTTDVGLSTLPACPPGDPPGCPFP